MLNKRVEEALNSQLVIEANSSHYYLAIASWAETKGLNGTSEFFYEQSDEERMHMLRLVKFINERGGQAIIPQTKGEVKQSFLKLICRQKILEQLRMFLMNSLITNYWSQPK